MSAKPYHVGHDMMVRRAASECDEVRLYVSLSDRRRAGEDVPVLGSDMALIWREVIEPTLPDNVVPVYGGSPVGNVWKELGRADEAGSNDTYVVYADADDLSQNFTDNLLERYCGGLFAAGRVKREATERAHSGSKMRAALAQGDKARFMAGLPASIDKEKVWDVLSATARARPKVRTTAKAQRPARASESLLREWVSLLLPR